jgi:predicted DNA-binding ribbon-helix-helix protein
MYEGALLRATPNNSYRRGMPAPYHPPVKRSVEIAGHKTSISLEPLFWDMLRDAAAAEGVPINAIVARIDAERIAADAPPGLAGAVRLWLAARLAAMDGRTGAG